MVISTLIGVISIVTLIITLVTKSHDPPSSKPQNPRQWGWGCGCELEEGSRACG